MSLQLHRHSTASCLLSNHTIEVISTNYLMFARYKRRAAEILLINSVKKASSY